MLKINAVYINICVCCYYSKPVAAILFTHGTTSGSASALIFSHRYNKIFTIQLAFITRLNQAQSRYLENSRDVNNGLTPKDQDKVLAPKDQDKDKDLTPQDQDKDKE